MAEEGVGVWSRHGAYAAYFRNSSRVCHHPNAPNMAAANPIQANRSITLFQFITLFPFHEPWPEQDEKQTRLGRGPSEEGRAFVLALQKVGWPAVVRLMRCSNRFNRLRQPLTRLGIR
jgi:hypothetical protein